MVVLWDLLLELTRLDKVEGAHEARVAVLCLGGVDPEALAPVLVAPDAVEPLLAPPIAAPRPSSLTA